MQTFEKALIDLVLAATVETRDRCRTRPPNRHDFLVALERAVKQRAVDVANTELEGD